MGLQQWLESVDGTTDDWAEKWETFHGADVTVPVKIDYAELCRHQDKIGICHVVYEA